LTIYSFDTLPSTQRWLTDKVTNGQIELPCAVIANEQTDGIGSRSNQWIGLGGNFFASVALPVTNLPNDLPLSAASIYFAFLMKMTLAAKGSKTWVKWPNDLYLGNRKIGGCITTLKKETVIAGLGINLRHAPQDFGVLDIQTSPNEVLENFLGELAKPPSWKQIFSNYRLEFEKSRTFRTHMDHQTVDLKEAVLQSDGSLIIGNKRVVSLR